MFTLEVEDHEVLNDKAYMDLLQCELLSQLLAEKVLPSNHAYNVSIEGDKITLVGIQVEHAWEERVTLEGNTLDSSSTVNNPF